MRKKNIPLKEYNIHDARTNNSTATNVSQTADTHRLYMYVCELCDSSCVYIVENQRCQPTKSCAL